MDANGSTTFTLTSNDLDSAQPALRLRLQEKSKELGKNKTRRRVLPKDNVENIKMFLQNLVTNVQDDIAFDYDCDTAKTERNKEKLKEHFKTMRGSLDTQESELLNQMDTLTPEQQEELLSFWGEVSKFIVDIFGWIKKTFEYVFEKIKDGCKLVKEAVQGFFKSVMDLLKSVF